jgi:hypothetical protein
VGNKCEKLGVGVGRDGLCLLRLAVLALARRSPRWRWCGGWCCRAQLVAMAHSRIFCQWVYMSVTNVTVTYVRILGDGSQFTTAVTLSKI